MTGAPRWRSNWLAVSPEGAVRVELDRSLAQRRAQAKRTRELVPGTPIVLTAAAPGAYRRCRRFAARTGIAMHREFLAVPSVAAPAYLVEDARPSLEMFLTTALVTPPGTPFRSLVDVALAVIRMTAPRRILRTFVTGRVAVGTRT